MASPKNKDEWVSYILNEIPSEELMNQAQVIGTPAFQRMMEEEGMEHIKHVGELENLYPGTKGTTDDVVDTFIEQSLCETCLLACW